MRQSARRHQPDEAEGRAPHAALTRYYRDDRERQQFLNTMFDQTAASYDHLADLMSFGTGSWYRRWTLRQVGTGPGMRVLDVATGTGAVARLAVRLVGPTGVVVGLDPSAGMLAEHARRPFAARLTRGVAESLPFADGVFDLVTMGYALRHVPDLMVTFREYRRVLRPGGRLLILDFYRASHAAVRGVGALYFGWVIPRLARLTSSSRALPRLMEYCWETVASSLPPAAIAESLAAAGLENVRVRRWGLVIEYHAARPGPGSGNRGGG
jgi:demethylmenaquinone methyltransferase / 2-methoxy-6-polyprenyl-1,4-benzoquinol methylase